MGKLYENRHPLMRTRVQALFTVNEICDLLNVSKSSWSQYENGKNKIPKKVLTKFATYLQLNEIKLKDEIDEWKIARDNAQTEERLF